MKESVYPEFPVILVDDEEQALDSFEIALRSANMNHFVRVQDSRDVMPTLSGREVEVMLLDLRMPHVSGEELLLKVNSDFPEIPVIIITGANDVETAVKCMKHGAFDYMVKPVEKSRLVSGVRRALELRELQKENRLLKAHVLFDKLQHPEAFSEIVTNSAGMRSIFQYVEAISKSPRPVLITGETGVGKELVAKAVHALSHREGDFIPVNVAGLDDNIFSDTLFGHKKGAFTGAEQARSGLIEQASGGTLFLDEIGDLSAPSQVKLLRLLQDGDFFPLGSDVAKGSNARIIVATNQDLDRLKSSGRFRKDLYYRLCDHHIHVPPLRERLEDLTILAEHFLEKASKTLDKKKPTPPDELTILLSTYQFPGNIRELESMVFNAVSSHKSGKLSMESFKSYIYQKHPSFEIGSKQLLKEKKVLLSFPEQLPTLKQAEQLLIDEAMKRTDGNQSIAALSLGITRQALNRRLKLKNK
ncbi:MAG: sigma-54 dependent transcriptional regulator [Desulfobacteraceae bacterium]|nr:sigma-54 dependent transcriptional regulator [Desulfobacteraceae bacterium]MDH3723300.1 sigma-54 dependent transcriptional regulator [Desulfobacteraceae bacterium]MDH3837671.1 sigma-54 dependent transcriptional regulator [Desulfobacteraceae bacterium]MDH3875683.1 sigma-54 dependent transcriptional regulator [Desulfobacteraceae bacterium]MDH3956725.1 sigma-54 dependent transcriptional regulator [Desulfobacteraceae bacterium]